MRKNVIMGGVMAAVLGLSLVACGGATTDDKTTTTGSTTTQEQSGGDFDAVALYHGQWRGSVEITGQTVYGTAGGNEQMLDVNLEEDGTCTVVPLEAHADLLNDEGTWEGTEDQVTLHLSKGDIVLSVVDSSKLEGKAADFDIADFDTINFDFYG